ncbi:hypothetical protein GCM10009869_13990 [Amnibacterium kyonggiense]
MQPHIPSRYRPEMSDTVKQSEYTPSAHPDLQLTGILTTALPMSLGTKDAPERYTVPAIFSRRPLPREVVLIEGSATHGRLSAAGFEHVALKVVDRRLEIEHTSLAELKSGLAAQVAAVLHEASELVAEQDDIRMADLQAFTDRETERYALVVAASSEIDFVRPSSS